MAAITYPRTWVDVCNRGLSPLGAEPITTLAEGTDRANLCVLHLPQAVETIVGGYDWNCLKERVELVQSAVDPVYEYDYKYTLPTDFGRAIEVSPKGYKYSIEEGFLLTDMDEEVYLLYIRMPTDDPTDVPGTLLNAISMELSAMMAFPLTSNAALQARIEEKSKAARLAAINQDNRSNDADYVAGSRGVDYSEERR